MAFPEGLVAKRGGDDYKENGIISGNSAKISIRLVSHFPPTKVNLDIIEQ